MSIFATFAILFIAIAGLLDLTLIDNPKYRTVIISSVLKVMAIQCVIHS